MHHAVGIKTVLCDNNFCGFQNNIIASNFSELCEKVICDIVICNKKCIFSLHPLSVTELLKPLEFTK